MFKKLFLSIVLFLCMTAVAFAGCIIPQGTSAWLFTPDGLRAVTSKIIVKAEPAAEELQPSAEWLNDFSSQVGEDYSDGIVVKDEYGYDVLIHKNQLKCD